MHKKYYLEVPVDDYVYYMDCACVS